MQTAGAFIKRKEVALGMNGFEYNGTTSQSLGVKIISKDIYSAPKYDLKFPVHTGTGRRVDTAKRTVPECYGFHTLVFYPQRA